MSGQLDFGLGEGPGQYFPREPAPPAPVAAPEPPRAVVEFFTGFAALFAYGPSRTAAQERQAAIVGAELAERLAAFRASGAA